MYVLAAVWIIIVCERTKRCTLYLYIHALSRVRKRRKVPELRHNRFSEKQTPIVFLTGSVRRDEFESRQKSKLTLFWEWLFKTDSRQYLVNFVTFDLLTRQGADSFLTVLPFVHFVF